jgi:hypothetical protein
MTAWQSKEFGDGQQRRPGRGLAGIVSPGQRKKKKTSSFLPGQSGMADRAGYWARQSGLVQWASVQVSPFPFFCFVSFSIFYFFRFEFYLNLYSIFADLKLGTLSKIIQVLHT